MLVPPPLFLLYRELSSCLTQAGCGGVALAASAGLALLAPAVAMLVTRAVVTDRAPTWLAPRPDDRTLAVLVAIVGGFTGYLTGAALGVFPGWFDRLLAPVAALLALPVVVVHAALIGATRSFGPAPMAVQFVAVATGIALSGAWWYVLAKTAAHGLADADGPRD